MRLLQLHAAAAVLWLLQLHAAAAVPCLSLVLLLHAATAVLLRLLHTVAIRGLLLLLLLLLQAVAIVGKCGLLLLRLLLLLLLHAVAVIGIQGRGGACWCFRNQWWTWRGPKGGAYVHVIIRITRSVPPFRHTRPVCLDPPTRLA